MLDDSVRPLSLFLRFATGLGLAGGLLADDPIVIRAMHATTIAEVFIEEESVRVEMEIGIADLRAFHNLLVDELRETLRLDPEPLDERLQRFFREDFVIRAGVGDPLPGRVAEIVSRNRVQRDAITGEALANQPSDAETVLYVILEFPIEGRPESLSIRPPQLPDAGGPAANVGFMTYHRGLPVTDFRYLGGEEVLDLDWEDPWFSRFRNTNLKRRFDAPISAYLYVEHYEARQEVVLRPVDLQQWVDLGLEGREVIPVAEQEALKQKVVDFLIACNPVTIDGVRVEPQLDRIHFLRRTLKQTGVIDPPEDLPIHSAMLGVIFYYPLEKLPEHAEMRWELFHPRFPEVPSAACDEAGGLPQVLTADQPVLSWDNFLVDPQIPGVMRILPEPESAGPFIPLLSLIAVGALFWVLSGAMDARRAARRVPNSTWAYAALAAASAVLLFPYARIPFGTPAIAANETRVVLGGLLHNVYRAFDLRDEERIYDTLERSVSGDFLTDVYLETRRGLELENQGGARARVKDVEMLETETTGYRSNGSELELELRSSWIVSGVVGHWGHLHQRRNQYDARFTLRFASGSWKIIALELLEEVRLSPP